MLSIRTFDPHKDLKAVFAPFMSPWALLFCYQSQVVAKSFNLTIHVVQYKSWPLLIMNLFSTTLEYSLVYGVILFVSCLFVFSLFEIYYDRKKNLWHIPGPFPLPLVGKLQLQQQFTFLSESKPFASGNSLLFAKPHELFMPTLQAVSSKRFYMCF